MTEGYFNLLDEPWIVVRQGTTTQEVPLIDVLCRAHEFDALAGELPTLDAALLRLLLAVMYGALTGGIDSYDDAIERWKALWEQGKLPGDAINAYLAEHRERFWLFHPDAPFFQVANLRTSDGRVGPIAQMIADVPSREERRFFSDLSGEAVRSLTCAQAARWLVHLQAWDYAGKKASVIGGAPNGGGTGWLGKLGVVYASGRNLFETLMLNFVLATREGPVPLTPPAWQQAPKTAAKCELTPRSYTELLTVQSRRAMLVREGERVTGIVSSYGDVFEKENLFIEQMSGWHESSMKGQGYIPNTHAPDRSMWRDLGAILPRRGEGQTSYRPGVLDWLAVLARRDALNLCAVGYAYGAMMGVVDTMICDSLTVNAALLGELGAAWVLEITDLLQCTDKAVHALGILAANLDKAAGGTGEGALKAAKEQAYFALDEPFRIWLRGIDPGTSDAETERARWKKRARAIVLSQGRGLADGAGDKAYTGRSVKGKSPGKGEFMNAPIAMNQFHSAVWKQLGGREQDEE